MLFNTRSAVASIGWVRAALEDTACNSSESSLAHSGKIHMLCELQNIVLQAAALSRYFWPARKGHEARAYQLRAAFNVSEESPLKNRDLRNEIEHFDERLDAHLSDGIVGYVFPEFVGQLPESDGRPTHIFRAYYVDAGVFEVLGKRYEIEPIAREILRLHDRLTVANDKGGRLGGP